MGGVRPAETGILSRSDHNRFGSVALNNAIVITTMTPQLPQLGVVIFDGGCAMHELLL
jgi:hypothetical protein